MEAMNDMGAKLHQVVEAVVSCCSMEINGKMDMTVDDILGKNRSENVVLTRQIVAMQISHAGYTNTTISQLLGCTIVNVRKLIADGYKNLQTNRAFHFAYAEATLKCKGILNE